MARLDRAPHVQRPLRRRALRRTPSAGRRGRARLRRRRLRGVWLGRRRRARPRRGSRGAGSPFVRRLESSGRRGDHDAVRQDGPRLRPESRGPARMRWRAPPAPRSCSARRGARARRTRTRPLRQAEATDRLTLAGAGEIEWEPDSLSRIPLCRDLGMAGRFRSRRRDCGGDPQRHAANRLVRDFPRARGRAARERGVGAAGQLPRCADRLPAARRAAGWTGDIQVFAPTASFLYDVRGFLDSWLRDLALEQERGGVVPFVVPNVLGKARPAAAWGDAATVVPWVLNERYADTTVLDGSTRA